IFCPRVIRPASWFVRSTAPRIETVSGSGGVTFGTCQPSPGPVVFAHMEGITMRQKISCNQRDLALLGHIGALALSALACFRHHSHTQYELPARHRPSRHDPIALAWARCNPGVPFPKALNGVPSPLAMSLAYAAQTCSSVGARKAA